MATELERRKKALKVQYDFVTKMIKSNQFTPKEAKLFLFGWINGLDPKKVDIVWKIAFMRGGTAQQHLDSVKEFIDGK